MPVIGEGESYYSLLGHGTGDLAVFRHNTIDSYVSQIFLVFIRKLNDFYFKDWDVLKLSAN